MDLMREIKDAQNHSRKILRFLDAKDEQWKIYGMQDKERMIRRNPWAVIHWEVRAPVKMQYFLWELARLLSITERLERKGRKGSTLYRSLLVHQEVVQIFIHNMILELIIQHEKWNVLWLFQNRKAFPELGGGWLLLFVQHIKSPLFLNKDRHA